MKGGSSDTDTNRWRYGAAHAARSLGWSWVDLLSAWYLHNSVGLTGAQTGWLLFAFLMLGGVTTFVVGLALSRMGAEGRTVVRLQLSATIVAAALLWLQFAVANVAAVIVVGVGFRIAYAFQDVAQNMLGSILPRNDGDLRRYARLRVTLSAVMRCFVVGAYAAMALEKGEPSTVMSIMLAVAAVAMIASAAALRQVAFPPPVFAATTVRPVGRTLPDGLAMLIAGWIAFATLLPTLNRLLIFAPAAEGLTRTAAWLLGGFCLGSVIGPALRWRPGWSLLLALIAASGAATIMPLPAPARVGSALVHGMAVSIIGVRMWATTAQIAIDDARHGPRRDGLVYGSVILAIHLSAAAGMLVLGPLIEGFEEGRTEFGFAGLLVTVVGALIIRVVGINERTMPAAA